VQYITQNKKCYINIFIYFALCQRACHFEHPRCPIACQTARFGCGGPSCRWHKHTQRNTHPTARCWLLFDGILSRGETTSENNCCQFRHWLQNFSTNGTHCWGKVGHANTASRTPSALPRLQATRPNLRCLDTQHYKHKHKTVTSSSEAVKCTEYMLCMHSLLYKHFRILYQGAGCSMVQVKCTAVELQHVLYD
jgi:hypothetical protein